MKHLVIAIVITLLPVGAFAGSNQPVQNTLAAEEIVTFAKEVEKFAAAKGARAFIISRQGRPAKNLPKGIRFTHTAIAVYSDITLSDGEVVQGYAIHNLYQKSDAPGESILMVDYPVDFFWGAHALSTGILIPTPEIQQRLIALIADGGSAKLHNPDYSVLANPMNTQFQNCTEHTLDMVNAAIYQTTDIARIKENTKAYFTPQRVKVGGFKLLFGEMFRDDITTDDHGRKIRTATFMSIGRYMNQYQLLTDAVVFNGEGKVETILQDS